MRAPLQASPNVTPMIDVMLVLLIIFMVVTPALFDGARIEPPRASHLREHPEIQGDFTLGIDATGHYYLNKRPVDGAALAERLRTHFIADTSDHVLYVKADRQLGYGILLAALDVARKNGVRVIAMVTEPERPASPRP
ncbi:MAG TPA: biopolymer transporter ExbD [Gemmatimonadaceae bacterium]|jgi:biopolymer transport protein ExbD